MKNKDAEQKILYIDTLFADFTARSFDKQMESHIAKYLTVIICGLYEFLVKDYMTKYIEQTTIPLEAKKYILFHIEKKSFQNPVPSNVKDFIKNFNQSWVETLNTNLKDQNWSALASIVSNKNSIAHGSDSMVTLSQIQKWYTDSKILISELDSIIP